MNYQQLAQLVDEYGSQGFKVLAFPCNQFGAQEPGTHEKIIAFVKKYDPDMPEKLFFFEKADVNGPNAREPYRVLKPAALEANGKEDIPWNFSKCSTFSATAFSHGHTAKFLVDRDGIPFKRYHRTAPLDMKADIEALMAKPASSS